MAETKTITKRVILVLQKGEIITRTDTPSNGIDFINIRIKNSGAQLEDFTMYTARELPLEVETKIRARFK